MSLNNNCCIDDDISKPECEKMLMAEFGFRQEEQQRLEDGPPWRYLVNDSGLCITTREVVTKDDPAYQLAMDIYRFAPKLSLSLRPSLSYDYAVSSGDEEIKVVNFLLKQTKGNFGFSSDFNQGLIIRRDGNILVRQDYEKWKKTESLENFFHHPFSYAPMNP